MARKSFAGGEEIVGDSVGKNPPSRHYGCRDQAARDVSTNKDH